jgi:HEAT repeat protein
MIRLLTGALAFFCFVGGAVPQTKDDVPKLIKELKDKDEIVRLKAAKALGKLGADAKDAIPALTEALKDSDEDVRSVAKQALAKIKEVVQASEKSDTLVLLAQHLKDTKSVDTDVRSKAILGLAKLLKTDDETVRSTAAKALGEAGLAAQPVLKELNDSAKDPVEGVRREARKAISAIETAIAEEQKAKTLEKLAPLLKDLKDKNPAVRQKAIESIAEMGADASAASEQLINALNDKAPAVQQSALDALEKVNPALHKPVLTLLVDMNFQTKMDAVKELGKLGSDAKPAIPLLLRFYQSQSQYDPRNPYPYWQHWCGVEILVSLNAIDSESKDFLATLTNAISINKESTHPQRNGFLDSKVRQKAIDLALELVKSKKLDASKTVKPLVSALADKSCRVQAIKALGELGVDAKDAIPDLTKLKTDSDKDTREAAIDALKKIQ